MTKAWSEVAASDAFKSLPPEQQDGARRQYFDDVVAPKVPAQQRDIAWDQFSTSVGVGRRELPAGVEPSRAGGGRGSVNPGVISLANARPRASDAEIDTLLLTPINSDVQQAPATVLEGMTFDKPQFDPAEAERLSDRSYAEATPAPGEERRARPVMKPSTGPDRVSDATYRGQALQDASLPVRAAFKAVSGVAKGAGGVIRAAGDATGSTTLQRAGAETTKGAEEFQAGMGETGPVDGFGPKSPVGYLSDMGEGAASSLGQSAAYASMFGAKAVIPLMSVMSAGEQYDKARTQGLDPAMALAGALPKGAFEAIGEKFSGLDKVAGAMGTILTKGASAEAKKGAADVLIKSGIKEIPGEVITYLGQTGVDLLPGIGLNPDLTMGQFVDGLRDTVVQAGMMGTAMGGGGAAVRADPRIKRLREAGETGAADLLQSRLDQQNAAASVETELAGIAPLADFAATPEYQADYRALRTEGIKPVEAAGRSAVTSNFRTLATTTGMPEKAVTLALETAKKTGLDKLPGFFQRYTQALAKRGLIQAPEGTDALGTELEAARDQAMNAAMGVTLEVEGGVRDKMAAVEALESGQNPAPALDTPAQAAIETIALGDGSNQQPALRESLSNRGGSDASVSSDFRPTGTSVSQGDSGVNVPAVGAMAPVVSGDAAALEGLVDGPVGNTDGQGNLVDGGAAVTQGDGNVNGPAQLPEQVLPNVGGLVGDNKVVGGVVEPVLVPVVDDLGGKQATAKDAFNNHPVLEPLAANAVNLDADQAVRGLVPREGADVAAGGRSAQGNSSKAKPNITPKTNVQNPPVRPPGSTEAQAQAAPAQAGAPAGSQPEGPAAAGAQAGAGAVEAAGIDGKQVYQIGGRDPSTRTYEHRADGRLSRTIAYPDGQSLTETLVTDKQGDDHWVSTTQYQKGEYFPAQLSQEKAEAAIHDDLAGTNATPKAAPASVETPRVILGRNNVPIAEGGKAFKTRRAADDARKLQPMMRVIRADGGYALTEKTAAQLAAQEKAARRLRNPQTSPPGQPIPAHAMIAAAGGLAPDERADMGMEGNVTIGNRKLFAGAGKGLTIERATEKLIEEGYLPEGAGHDQARALIQRSLTQPQYTAEGFERMAEAETQARFDTAMTEEEAIDDAVAQIEALSDNQFDALLDAEIPWDAPSNTDTVAAMKALGFTDQEIQDATANESGEPQDDRAGRGEPDEGATSQAQANPAGREEAPVPAEEVSPAAIQTPADAGVSVSAPAFESKLRADGTLAITGDAKAIRELLSAIPAKSLVAMKGGILVGRTQADKAAAILRGEKPKLTAREAAEAGQAAREAEKKAKAAAARAKPAAGGLTVGIMPGNAEVVTVRDGIVYIGKAEALDFDSGEPVRVKDGATDSEIVNALKVAGALSRRQRVFGLVDEKPNLQGNRVDETANLQEQVLTSPTPADVLAQQQAKEDGAKAEAAARAEEASKAKADAELGEFTLTGSDRPADIAAAAGQSGLFDVTPEAQEKITDLGEKLGGGQIAPVTLRGSESKDALAAKVYGRGETYKNLPSESKRRIDAMFDDRMLEQTGFDITPAMREKATAGLPMFGRQGFDADAFSRMFSPPSAMAVTDVQKAVDQLTSKWKSGPTIKVVATPADLPIDAPADARGLIQGDTAYIVANNHVNRDAVARTLGHEAVGHYGLWRMLGDEGTTRFNRNLQLALKSGNVPLNKLRDKVRAAYVDGKGKFNLSAAEESSEIAAFAVEAAIDPATGEFKPGFGFVKEVYAKVAEFLRSLGIDIKFTNAELHGMLVSAMRGLEAGHKLDGGADVLVAAARTPPAALQPIQTPVGTAFQSDDVVLGKPRLNVRQPGGEVTRVDFEIRDPQRFAAAKAAGATPAQARDAANVGVLTMDMDKAGQFRSLRNIEVFESKRGDGLAGKVVGSIMGTMPEGGKLHIHDILPTATGFWDKMGAKFARSDDFMEAFLTPAQFRSAYANTETRAAGEKGPSDKPGPTLYARSGKGGSGNDGQAAGESPAASAKGVTQTEKFKKWFGDWTDPKAFSSRAKGPVSVAVGDGNKPLVLYHATNRDFGEFKVGQPSVNSGTFGDMDTERHGIFTTPDIQFAEQYLKNADGQNVMPVYASIKSPMDMRGEISGEQIADIIDNSGGTITRRDFYGVKASETWQFFDGDFGKNFVAAAKKAGYDGAIIKEYSPGTDAEHDVYVAFEPTQLKSVTGNNGDFDGGNPNIAFARGTGNLFQPNIWSMPEATRTDRVIYELQDGKVDLKRAQEAIKASGQAIKEEFDARLAETLYPGRVAYRSATFLDVEAKPLLEAMARNNVGMDELADYLHARGAEERNAQIAKVNPSMPDGGAGTNTKGELMTNQAARDYLANVPRERKLVLDAMARRVDTITAGTRALLVAEGLEKQETIDAWEGAYKNYVPMFRDEAESAMPPHPQGAGFQVKGSASKRATGSTKEVTNILAHVLMQREAAITRAEKNRVALALYGQALSHPNPDFWTTIRPGMKAAEISSELVAMGVDPMTAEVGMEGVPTIRTVDPVTNKVVDRPNPIYRNLPGAIPLKVNGADRVLMLNVKTERGQRLATSLKNLDGLTQLDLAGHIVGRSTRFMAAMLTQYNPAFGLVNVTRDVMSASVNLTSTELSGKSTKVVLNAVPSAIGIARELFKGGQTGTWQKLYRQFQADGGQTGFKDNFRDPNERAKAVEKELAALQKAGTLTAIPGRVTHLVMDLLDGFNTTLENAVRLSAYKAALDKGISRAEAARLGRELTVDFNRKGRLGRELGPLYAFFNASVQGSARTIETLRGPRGGLVIAGGIGLGVLQALMLAAAGYEDDEVAEFIKARTFVIPMNWTGAGDKTHILIPMGLGLHILPNIGRVFAELTLNGGKDIGKRSVAAIGEIAGAFNPLGGGNIFTADGALKTVAPTLLDPVIEMLANKDFTGKPIEKESYGGETDNRPGIARVKLATQRSTTGQAYMGISKAINFLTGGTDYEAGLASPTPEMVRYMAQTVGGGVLREFEKTINASTAAARGEKVKMSGIPVAGRFYGEVDDDQTQTSRYFENSRKVRKVESSVKAARKAGDDDTADAIEDRNPEAVLIREFNKTQRALAALNKEAVTVVRDVKEMAQIDQDRAQLMRDFNADMEDLEREAGKITLADRLRTATRPKVAEMTR